MIDQTADVRWLEGGVPLSSRFDDPYFSRADGLAETRHVFLGGNDLPARFRPGFHVAELGFGTGLNLFATLLAWRAAGIEGPLRYTSFEAWPMRAPDMERALRSFAPAHAIAAPILAAWEGGARRIQSGDLHLEVIVGDARETLALWPGEADAWYLDGFSPARNPELWGEDLLAQVGAHTRPLGSAATYSAAGHVRRALASAGFEVTRCAGYGRKRHMTQARKPKANAAQASS